MIVPILQRQELRFHDVLSLPKAGLEQGWNPNPGLMRPESVFITFMETRTLEDGLCRFVSLNPHNNLVNLLLSFHLIENQTKTWKLRSLP